MARPKVSGGGVGQSREGPGDTLRAMFREREHLPPVLNLENIEVIPAEETWSFRKTAVCQLENSSAHSPYFPFIKMIIF